MELLGEVLCHCNKTVGYSTESRKLYGPFYMAILLKIASAAHTLKEENIHWNLNWQILRLLTGVQYIMCLLTDD